LKQINISKNDGFIKRVFGRSLFLKYFSACALTLLMSFFVLGTLLAVFSIKYSNLEKENLFLDNAKKISSNLVKIVESNDRANMEYLSLTLSMTAYNLDASIYITDSDGNLLTIVNSQIFNPRPEGKISKSVMNTINSRKIIKEEGTLGGYFDRLYTTAGVPLISGDGSTVEGAVFVFARSGSSMKIVSDIFKIFIICVILILIIASMVIYFITSHLVRPLRQMSDAALSFSKGDFSARIPVRSADEVGQLAVAFNNMASSLASLESMRSSFVANVSHELKTPMTSIAGFIDGILDGTIPQEKEKYYLKIVSDEVKRLSRLVRSFLDIARIEAGELKINPTDFDIMELIRRVIIGFEQPIENKSLEIRGLDNDDKIMVTADFDLTYQIVYNLVDNAVKFANQNGYIEINVATKSKKIYVSVKNSGIGIPAKELPFVFDRFYKTDKSRSRDRKGFGLGLYIVKKVLNEQGHDIVVKSVEGEFCEFVFTLSEAK
jgi:signal transduction histidine kinase